MDRTGMEQKAMQTIHAYQMLEHGSGILVGFSGGADSTALLYFLSQNKERFGFSLYAVHINHMIRGQEADHDQYFCEEFCKTLEIPLWVRREDVPKKAAETGKSLEETARDIRYHIFEELQTQHPTITRIATAHNADDNMETILFHLCRGSGIQGISGIPPVRGNIIRPLLLCTKAEIIAYCENKKIAYCTDSTNFDTEYTRNYIRHEILPQLRQINGNAAEAFARMGMVLRQDALFLQELATQKKEEQGITTSAPVAWLQQQPESIRSRILFQMFASASACNQTELQYVHLQALYWLLANGKNEQEISLPQKITARLYQNKLVFLPTLKKEKQSFHYPLQTGENHIPFLQIFVGITENEKDGILWENIYKLLIHITVNSARIKGELFLRSREDGDAYRFGNMTRKVKKLLQKPKIPAEQREQIPLFCDDAGIFWIPGFRVRDSEPTSNDTEGRVLHIFYGKDNG